MATASDTADQVTVYRPHRAGLPNLRAYFKEVLRRLDFARELSNTNMRAQNTNTVLGQLWLIVNPLLLAGVYFLLIMVIGNGQGADFAQITGGLFVFFFISGAIQACATSVTNAGSLVLNMSFPKQVLIVSNVYLALRRFLPTMLVYAAIHLIWQKPITVHLLWIPVVVVLAAVMSLGLGSMVATWHVYFRDTAQFLPYFIRIWMYLSPVLYTVEHFFATGIGETVGNWAYANPIFALLGIWGSATHGTPVDPVHLGIAAAWSLGLCVVGVLYFISREREFAVRL